MWFAYGLPYGLQYMLWAGRGRDAGTVRGAARRAVLGGGVRAERSGPPAEGPGGAVRGAREGVT